MDAIIQWFTNDFRALFAVYWPVPIGVLILIGYGIFHFNTPAYPLARDSDSTGSAPDPARDMGLAETRALSPPAYTTTRERYRRAQWTYVLGLVGIFLIVALFPDVATQTVSVAAGGSTTQLDFSVPAAILDRVVWTLFVLTGFITAVPGLRDLDAGLLRLLHEKAAIPDDVRLTASQLYDETFEPGEAITRAALGRMNDDNNLESIDYERTDLGQLERDWFKVACLYYEIKRWLGTQKYRRLRHTFELEMTAIEKEFELRKAKLAELLVDEGMESGPSADELTDSAEKLAKRRERLTLRVDALFYRLCLFASLLVFATETSIDEATRRFNELGFRVTIQPLPHVNTEALIKVGCVVAAVTVIPSLAYVFIMDAYSIEIAPSLRDLVPTTRLDAIYWSLAVVVLHALCVWLGMTIKRRAAKRHRKRYAVGQEHERSPVVENFVVGVICWLVTFGLGALMFVFYYELRVFEVGIVWALSTATTGVFVAYYVDRILEERPIGRLPMLQSAITAGIALIATLGFTPEWTIIATWPDYGILLYTVYACLVSGLIGLSVGLIFPKSYGQNIREDVGAIETPENVTVLVPSRNAVP